MLVLIVYMSFVLFRTDMILKTLRNSESLKCSNTTKTVLLLQQ